MIWIQGEYKGQKTTEFQQFRRGRSADDVEQSRLRVLHSVQNRLTSFCSSVACKLKDRLSIEKDHRSAELIKTMGDCLDIRKIIEKGKDDAEFNDVGEESLIILMRRAKYPDPEAEAIIEEYNIFKSRLIDLNLSDKTSSELIRLHEHTVYRVHECSQECIAKTKKIKAKLFSPKFPFP